MMDNEKEVISEYEADAIMRNFIEVNTVSAIRFNEWFTKFTELDKLEKNCADDMTAYANKLLEQDGLLLDRLKNMQNRISKIQSLKLHQDIVDIFKTIFIKMCSRTTLVAGKADKSYSEKITIGTTGFGLRFNKRSAEMKGINDLINVLSKKDEIITSMKGMRGMQLWITKFERFAKLVSCPEMFVRDSPVMLVLDRPVLLPTQYESRYEGIKEANHISFSVNDMLTLKYGLARDVKEGVETDVFSGSHKVMSSYSISVYCGFSYMQLRSKLPDIVKRFEAKIIPSIESVEGLIPALQKEFKSELTLQAF